MKQAYEYIATTKPIALIIRIGIMIRIGLTWILGWLLLRTWHRKTAVEPCETFKLAMNGSVNSGTPVG